MARARKIARIAGWVVASVLGGAAVVVLAALIALQTDWGREQVRTRVETGLGQVFSGPATIGSIEGSVLDDIVIRNVSIRHPDGRPAIDIAAIRLSYELMGLLENRFYADELIIEQPTVWLRFGEQGQLDLTRILRPREPRKRGWEVSIDHLEVRDGAVALTLADGSMHDIRNIVVDGAVEYEPGAAAVQLEQGFARWVQRDLGVTVSGRMATSDDELSVSDAWIHASASEIALPSLMMNLGTGSIAAEVAVSLASGDLGRYVEPRWRAPVRANASVTRDRSGAPWRVGIEGALADAVLSGSAELGIPTADDAEPTVDAQLSLQNLDPSQIWAGAPRGELRADAELSARGRSLETATASITGTATGTLAVAPTEALAKAMTKAMTDPARGPPPGHFAAELSFGARLAEQVIKATIIAKTPYGDIDAQATVDLGGRELSATGTIEAEELRWRDVRADRASVDFSVSGIPDQPAGRVAIEARDVARQGSTLGRLSATAVVRPQGKKDGKPRDIRDRSIEITLRAGSTTSDYAARAALVGRITGDTIRIRLGSLRLRTRELTWKGSGTVAINPEQRVVVPDLRLSSAAGRVELGGRVSDMGKRGTLDVHVRELDLSAIGRALPPATLPVRGQLSLDAALALGAWTGTITGSARNLAWREGAPPLDIELDAALADRVLDADVVVDPDRAGRATARLRIRTPPRPWQVDAWRPFQRQWVEHIGVELDKIDLGRIARLAPEPPELEGIVSGTLEVTGGLDDIDADLRLRRARAVSLRRAVDISVRGTGARGKLRAEISVDTGGVHLADVSVSIGAGVGEVIDRIDDPERLARIPVHGYARMPWLPLARVGRLVGIPAREALRGNVQAYAQMSGTAREPRIELHVQAPGAGARGVAFTRFNLDATLAGTGAQRFFTIEGEARQDVGGTITLFARGSPDSLASTTARLHAEDLRLEVLNPVLDVSDAPLRRIKGRIDTSLTITAASPRPRVAGTLTLRGGSARFRSGIRRIDGATMDVTLSPDTLVVRAAASSGGGRLSFSGRSKLDQDYMPTAMRAELSTRQLPFIAGATKVALDLDADLRGTHRDGLWRFTATVEDGLLMLPSLEQDKLHSTAPLRDVVYVDQRERRHPLERRAGSTIRLVLRTPSGIRIRGGDDLDLRVTANLGATLINGTTVLDGSVEAQRGTASIFDRRYELLSGRVSFDGSVPPNPRLDLRLRHSFKTTDLFIDVEGTLEEPRIELRSEPAIYSRADLLSFVLGGDPDRRGTEELSVRSGATRAASALIAGTLESLIERRIPVDTVRIGTADEDASRLSYVTVGKWLGDDLFVAYRRRFDADQDENNNEARLEYHFRDRWMLESTVGDRGSGNVDVLWVKRY